MATTSTKAGLSITPSTLSDRLMPVNTAPAGFDAARDLPDDFLEFLAPLHAALTLRQRALIARREAALQDAHAGKLPDFLQPSVATTQAWEIELPEWCSDQRNQMTGPADDAELVVKMLNSGAPGVMLDLEDSNANTWEHLTAGVHNVLEALAGRLNYFDKKRNRAVSIQPSKTVLFTRPRGLHLYQAGVLPGELLPASLFDVTMIAYQADFATLKHPLCFYIPKSESAHEALWWRDLFQMIERAKGLPANAIKCMALVEARPLGLHGQPDSFQPSKPGMGFAGPQYDSAQRRVFPEFAHADAGDLPQARHAGHRGHDRALSEPRQSGAERARACDSCRGQKERSVLLDGRRVDRPSAPERNRGRAVPCSESAQWSSEERRAASRPASPAYGCRQAHPGRYARSYSHCDSLPQRRIERPRREPAGRLHGRPGHRPHLPADDCAAREA